MAFIRAKEKKGHRYYYIVENRRDGPGGRTRQHTLEYIGPEPKFLEAAIGWWEQARAGSQQPVLATTFKSYDYGAPAALWKVAETLGLEGILDSTLPRKTVKGMPRSRVLTLAMIHHAVDPENKAAFSGWCEGTSLPYHLGFDARELDAQAIWEAMDGITEGEVNAAQHAIVAKLRELFPDDLDRLRLDYSSYHVRIDSRNGRCTICTNKQRRDDVHQLSLAMLTSTTLPAPIVWEPYEGDKGEFSDFIEKVAKEEMGADANDYTVIFDDDNARESLGDLPFHFVCSHSLAGLEHLCDIDRSLYEEVDRGDGHTRMAYRIDGLTFSGVTGTGVLTLSDDLYQSEVAGLEKMEAQLRAKAADLSERLGKPRSSLYASLKAAREKASSDFDEGAALRQLVEAELFEGRACCKEFWSAEVTCGKDGRWKVTVTCDEDAREAYCLRTFGKLLTVTDRTGWTTAEILAAVASQERAEDLLKTTKGSRHFSMHLEGNWTDDRVRMYVFTCLTAVTLTEVLRRLLADSAGIGLTKHALLDRLDRIHDGWVTIDGKPRRAIEDLGTKERRLWDAVVALPGETLGVDNKERE